MFTNYLAKVSDSWKTKIGFGTTVPWPVGVGGKGNEGVSAYVKQIKNSIGFVEYAYALQNKMTYAQLKNASGTFVKPDAKAFQAAADTADWANAKDFNLIMTNAPGEGACACALHAPLRCARRCCCWTNRLQRSTRFPLGVSSS